MSTPRRAGHSPRRPDPNRTARLQRDAGLERGRSITKGIAFGSAAAVAMAGVYLSQSLPGHSATPSSSQSGASSAGSATPAAPVSSGSGDGSAAASQGSGISAPASAPAPAYQQAPVVSSGSS